MRRPPHRIGDEVADGGLARAHRGSATVELDRGRSDRRVEFLAKLVLELCDDCRDFGVGHHHRRVDNAELRPAPYTTPSALFTDIDDDVDRGDIVGVVARFYHRGAAAILDEQIVGVASEKEIDCAAAKDLVTLFAGDMSHGDDEIGAFAAQRRGLFIQGGDRRQESEVSRVGRADAVVIGRAGEPDADAVDGHDGAILEVRQRLPFRAAQVGGIKRELGFGHPLQECGLAEIEFVIARYEDVGRDQIGQRHDVRAVIDARHQRG